jgi:AdoMet-dependent rRNA methyltransferase SPB1
MFSHRPILPVTKEEVAVEKARLKSIDSRPIKKVAEAKARKRMKLHARLSSAREKAETIASQVTHLLLLHLEGGYL